MSKTISLAIPDALYEALSTMAAKENKTAEDVGQAWLAAAIERIRRDPMMQMAGCLDSATPDLAEQHDEYLAETLDPQLDGRD